MLTNSRAVAADANLPWRIPAPILLCLTIAACGSLSSFNASIRLDGRVEDPDGRPLEQVRLDVRESRLDLMSESFTSKDEHVLELSDGRFQVSCRSCSSMTLHFSKKGYYSESLNFRVEKGEVPAGRRSGDEARDLVRSDLKVVLRSDENEAKLVRYESFLTSAADGTVRVAPLRRDLGSRGVLLERLRKPPSKAAQYVPGFLRLRAAIDEKGALAARQLPDVPGARMRFPAPATLELADVEGGIVFHAFEEGNPAAIYRAMRTAPAEGYEATFTLDTADRSGTYFFYFRIGDRYGKGSVGVPSFGHADDGREVVMSHIEIRLNPDGSRNVETGR